jgi:predicted O-methyltransferase YrrM
MRPEEVPARPECPEPSRWVAPDGNATETDVSALIGSLVMALKPDYIIETGSYHGDTTYVMGRALAELGRGHLLSLDIEPEMVALTQMRCLGLPVTVQLAKASEVVPSEPIDLLFIDSGLDDRMVQIRAFKPYASPRCVIVMHDSAIWHIAPGMADFYVEMQKAVDDGVVLPWLKLPTPRGLALTRYK